jgi:hypothetical protein
VESGVESGGKGRWFISGYFHRWAVLSTQRTIHTVVLFGRLKEVGVICRFNGGLEVATTCEFIRDTFTAGWYPRTG